MQDPQEVVNFEKSHGFSAIDLERLFSGSFRELHVGSAISGMKRLIHASWTADNISFLMNFEEFTMMPLPHYNVLSFAGMGSKSDYLIWR